MKQRTLIVSDSRDIHVERLCEVFHEKQHPYFFIQLDHFPRDYRLSQIITDNGVAAFISHIPTGQTIDLADVTAIWARKSADYAFIDENMTEQEYAFAKQEIEQVLFGLLYSLDCFWLNHPLDMRKADWKCEQLTRATQHGFKIPPTITTNQPEKVRQFAQSYCGEMIYKALSSPLLAADQVSLEQRQNDGLATSVITQELMEQLDSIEQLPCHFQQYIPKQFELRVTIIGEQIFATKIDSQSDAKTRIDSRNLTANIQYSMFHLPEYIKQACLKFMHSYQLNYSAMDFIVTPDNEYVFLENNPNGQFMFIDELVPGYNLFEELANLFISKANA